MEEYIQIGWSAAHLDEARDILEMLIEKKLISCGSIFPSVESWYEWDEEIISTQEVKVSMKTVKKHYKSIESLIKASHSYEIPEILAFAITDGNDEYFRWMNNQIKK